MVRGYRDVGYDSSRWAGFEFRDDDIVISAPAKSGTTWLQMCIALLVFGSPELPKSLSRLSPWLDMQTRAVDDVVGDLTAQQHRRFIKTHTPLDGLELDPRVSYVTVGRDPRDVAVSFISQYQNVNHTNFRAAREAAVGVADLPELAKPPSPPPTSLQDVFRRWIDFEGGETTWGLVGNIHHLDSFWDRRDEDNIVMVHFADMQTDLVGQMSYLADRLGLERSAQEVERLARAASFNEMKASADQLAPNADQGIWRSNADFFRSDTTGKWRELWDEETLSRYRARASELASPELVSWMERS